ncbi:MAG: hypothetical protein AVDCRST_MAG23-1135 [uncultured Sphingosinicella sp.]|uniref:DUF2336 domain-containing protein n=1 Tax=uncultured Sphingosinicella sp. TaxID=478748 RepID=A0A6J4TTR1_9SPHN|nr:DUF2336 domain-containing protein [uncultured Sphingosinicella sp.]CAA9531397.1 MAG: hypothetical protein AVDCRST_MAG23-1135 [uncultured Sphingosinicella sp.]
MAETARQDDAARLLLAASHRRAVATTDLFLTETLRLSDRQRATVRTLLDKLVRAIEDELRASLAETFAGEAALQAALASAHVQIVVPLLARSEALHDPELVAILLRRVEEHRIYRGASRADDALQTLIADRDAAIAATAMAVLTGRSRRLDRFHDPVLARTELPADVQHRLVWTIAAALRRYMADQHGIDPAAADSALASAAGTLLSAYDEGDTLDARSVRLAQRLGEAERLDGAAFLSFLTGGTLTLFLAGLSVRTGLSYASVWDVLSDPAGRGLVYLLRAAGIPRQEAAAILIALGSITDEAGLASAVDLFDVTNEAAARRALSLWSLDPAYRAALIRIGEPRGAA